MDEQNEIKAPFDLTFTMTAKDGSKVVIKKFFDKQDLEKGEHFAETFKRASDELLNDFAHAMADMFTRDKDNK